MSPMLRRRYPLLPGKFPALLGGAGAPRSSTLLYDTFTDTDSTALADHTPETAPAGSAWATAVAPGMTITGNRAWSTTPGQAGGSVIECGAANGIITITQYRANASSTSIPQGAITRYVDTQNYWRVGYRVNTDAIVISETTANVTTERASAALGFAWANGASKILTVTLAGQVITGQYTGGNSVTYTSSSHQTATKHGCLARAAVNDFIGIEDILMVSA